MMLGSERGKVRSDKRIDNREEKREGVVWQRVCSGESDMCSSALHITYVRTSSNSSSACSSSAQRAARAAAVSISTSAASVVVLVVVKA
jgi:hypothetical protein